MSLRWWCCSFLRRKKRRWPSFQLVGCDEDEQDEEKRKKTEHTNISHFSLKLRRQNIHVMLSYAIITGDSQQVEDNIGL